MTRRSNLLEDQPTHVSKSIARRRTNRLVKVTVEFNRAAFSGPEILVVPQVVVKRNLSTNDSARGLNEIARMMRSDLWLKRIHRTPIDGLRDEEWREVFSKWARDKAVPGRPQAQQPHRPYAGRLFRRPLPGC